MQTAKCTCTLKGRGIVKGRACGPALCSHEAISFLGDIDIQSGLVVGDLPSIAGQNISGTVLLMPASRGSAGAWRFLYQLYKHNTHPVALMSRDLPDPSVVQGAILANIPIVCGLQWELLLSIENGSWLEVDGSGLIQCYSDKKL